MGKPSSTQIAVVMTAIQADFRMMERLIHSTARA